MKVVKPYIHELLLLVALGIFVLAKMPQLTLPYFWDELGVYSRGALYLFDNGISMLPSSMPSELSRGHPLLFYVINALSFKVFGTSLIAGHLMPLVGALLFIYSVYAIGKKHISKNVGLLSAILLLVQPLFVAQSILMLPEIYLALFILISIHYFIVKKYLLFILASSAAILTKESAIIITPLIIASEIVLLLLEKQKFKAIFFKKILIGFSPIFIFVLFICVQKIQNGWYFFPYHIDNVKLSLQLILKHLSDFSWFLWIDQGRIAITIFTFLLGIIWLNSTKKFSKINPLIIYCILLIIGGLLFSAINFSMNRYILFLLPPFLFIFCILLLKMIVNKNFVIVIVCICIVPAFIFMHPVRFNYDENMSYVDAVQLHQQGVDHLLAIMTPDASVFANFPIYHALSDWRLGYLKPEQQKKFTLIKGTHQPIDFDYIIIADPGSYDHQLPASSMIKNVVSLSNATGKVVVFEPL